MMSRAGGGQAPLPPPPPPPVNIFEFNYADDEEEGMEEDPLEKVLHA
jgi:hypothetical protein